MGWQAARRMETIFKRHLFLLSHERLRTSIVSY